MSDLLDRDAVIELLTELGRQLDARDCAAEVTAFVAQFGKGSPALLGASGQD